MSLYDFVTTVKIGKMVGPMC